jgi:hypothetical protein
MDFVDLNKSEFGSLSVAASKVLLDPSSEQGASTSLGTAPDGEPRTPSNPTIPLEKVNSQAAKAIYKPLGTTEIRLVKIHPGSQEDQIQCSIFNVEQEMVPAYEALSYVWGSSADPKSISLNGAPWKVNQNLEGALRRLRHLEEDRVMWIDALSIDQSNILERNFQVTKMRDIYALAPKTLVWLGNGDNLIIVIFFMMINLRSGEEALNGHLWMKDLEEDLRDNTLLAFSEIRGLDYWTRVWVAQEIMYSRDVSFLYGSYSATYSEFAAFWNAVVTHFNLGEGDGAQIYDRANALAHLKGQGLNALPRPGAALAEEYTTLQEWRNVVEIMECTDPRDMVFGYYGCFPADIRRQIVIDYSKSLEDILVHTMRVLVEDSDRLDVILDTPESRTGPPLPSWVPRVRQSELSKFIFRFSEFEAHGDVPPVYRFCDGDKVLQVGGVCVAVVQATAQHFHKDESIPGLRDWMQSESLYIDFMTYLFGVHESLDIPLQGDLFECYVAAIVAHTGTKPAVVHYLLKGCLEAGFDPSKWPFKPEWSKPLWQIGFAHFGRRMFSFVGTKTLDKVGDGDACRPIAGYGLGAKGLAQGDKVCILAGCSVPAILRPSGDHYTVLGDAYVPGFMFGEAMSGVQSGTYELETFFLC